MKSYVFLPLYMLGFEALMIPLDTDSPLRYSITRVAWPTTCSLVLLPMRSVLVVDLRRVLPHQLS